MTTPIDPEFCKHTGRLLTEWFEYPERTDEEIYQEACEAEGVSEMPEGGTFHAETPLEKDIARRIAARTTSFKKRRWRNNMTKQEVAMRLNEATKMVNPDNQKFLPDDVRERTGLEVNPLWMMETLVRSGALSPKEQVTALKELAGYTHSKAPSISHNTNINGSPEDWLEDLASTEYREIDLPTQRQSREMGSGDHYEKNIEKRQRETAALSSFGSSEREQLESQIDDAEFTDLDEGD